MLNPALVGQHYHFIGDLTEQLRVIVQMPIDLNFCSHKSLTEPFVKQSVSISFLYGVFDQRH